MPVAFVDVNGRRTRVLVEGDDDRDPILLLHGIGRSLDDWEPQFANYRRAGYRVIALDLPGSGFSDRLATPTTVQTLAQGVFETLDAIGENRRLHVMGNSLGGAVAMQMLTLQPDRVGTLVLVASAGFGSEVHPMLRFMTIPGIGSFASRNTTRASARMAERLLYADATLATRERIEHALKIGRRAGTGAVFYETSRSLGTVRGVKRQWRDELMSEVKKQPRPTLIAWGEEDRILPAKQLESARELIPHAQIHLCTRVGHMPQVEIPDEFAALTLDFLRGNAAA
jgi:pimeloyl-ACP methyl ester carboxylesterase